MIEYLAVIVTITGIATSFSILLQTWKIIHLHESRDIALPMYLVFLINSIFWVLYGYMIGDLPILISFSVGLVATISVIAVYFIYRKQKKIPRSK